MVGYEPPEAAAWRAGLPEKLARAKAAEDAFDRLTGREMRQRWLEGKPLWPERDLDREPAEDEDDGLEDDDSEDYAADDSALDDPFVGEVDTIRRATPKVGRNDPCPCGSGKKHKKCCLRANEG
jgi:preprotein translocase subunit SecA